MSYDLFFYKKTDNPLSEKEFAEYLDDKLVFNVSDHPNQWEYHNPSTGVYFLIDWNTEGNDSDNELLLFEGYVSLNFSCCINFLRPSYFGLELFPIIDNCVKDLNLYLLNYQDVHEPEQPMRFARGYLEEQWIRLNENLSRERFDEYNLLYMPRQKSDYVWLTQLHRDELQLTLGEGIFVAGNIVIKSFADNKLYTAVVWPEHIPIVFPEVDYFIIQKKYKHFFREVEETGMVSYEDIIEEFSSFIEDFGDKKISGLKIITPANAEKARKRFNTLKLKQKPTDFGAAVALDGFVNAIPQNSR